MNGDTRWFDDPDEFLHHMREEPCAVLCHHAQFDCFILSHRYGIRPRFIFDTLSMARLVLGTHVSASLDSVRAHFGMPAKRTPYHLFKGRHWSELDASTRQLIVDGARDEVESIWRIFQLLDREFPTEEYPIVDATVRMFTEPCLGADVDLLGRIWTSENERKRDMLANLDVGEDDLQSPGRFQALLEAEGIEIQYKNGKNGRPIPSLSKNDEFMQGLLESEDDRVRALAMARLGVKSTLAQTRAERVGDTATRGPVPIYLSYNATHSTRWGGGDKLNWQNIPRPGKPGAEIVEAITAPDGWLIARPDLSQIECRLLNLLAGQHDVVDRFRRGDDLYIERASQAYGREITRDDKAERGSGKQIELSCGYMAGAKTIQRTARLGTYGPKVIIDEATAERWKQLYRSTHPAVVNYWGTAGRLIARLAGGPELQWGPLTLRDGRIYLPNGAFLHYETLEHYTNPETGEAYWRHRTRKGWDKLYSGKLVAHVVSSLARVILSQAMNRFIREGLKIVLTVHDDLAILVKDDQYAKQVLDWILVEMTRPPQWLLDLPLAAEGQLKRTLGK